jgi:hypothetical protein
VKFILLVEGDSERKTIRPFLKRWLDRRLSRPVRIDAVNLNGFGDFWRHAPKRAQKYVDDPRQADIFVFGLLDLAGPNFFPAGLTSAQERENWAVAEIERKVNRPCRFRMFFAVHEFEAWILSQPKLLPFDPPKTALNRMQNPESVNFDESPSKLLDRLYRDNGRGNYKKITYGVQLFGKLDPEVAYAKCPHLKDLLDAMLALASQARH